MLLPSEAWHALVPDAAEHLLHVGVRHEGLLLALDGELQPVQGLVRAWAPHRHLYTLYCTVLYCTVLYCTLLYCTVLCAGVLLARLQAGPGGGHQHARGRQPPPRHLRRGLRPEGD